MQHAKKADSQPEKITNPWKRDPGSFGSYEKVEPLCI